MEHKPRENLKHHVYTVLKHRIIRFDLKPGERLQERELAEQLGVSRTPIREAMNKLEQEGFIKTSPNKGYFVSAVTKAEVEELYRVRSALESLLIREAIQKGSKEDWAHLEGVLRKGIPGEDEKKRKDKRFDIGRTFHEEIARISGNQTLIQLLKTISERMDRIRWVDIFYTNRAEQSLKEHLEILELLKRGKIEEAVSFNQKHIQHAQENILRLLDRKMDLFYIT